VAGHRAAVGQCRINLDWRQVLSIIGWLIVGALAGWIASLIAGTNARQGWLMNIVLGVVGAIVGGFLWQIFTGEDVLVGFNLGSLVLAVIGALIVTFVVGALSGRRV
jgi:uncharacterized membrane protein YeaQ/YmgE (transglycosylase-associated protein family)